MRRKLKTRLSDGRVSHTAEVDHRDQVWEGSSKPDCQMVGSVTLLRLTTETRCEKEAQNQTVRW